MLQVHYARDAWRTNGQRIQIRPIILSNFHVQSFSIRATVYLLLIRITVSCYVYPLWTSQSGLQVGAAGLVDPVNN